MHAWSTSMLLLLHSTFMLSVLKMLLKREFRGSVLNSHWNYIVDHGKSWKNHGIVFLYFCGNPVLTISRKSFSCLVSDGAMYATANKNFRLSFRIISAKIASTSGFSRSLRRAMKNSSDGLHRIATPPWPLLLPLGFDITGHDPNCNSLFSFSHVSERQIKSKL